MSNTMTFGEFAAALGCKASYVTQLKRDGRLVLTEDGRRILVAESRALIAATSDPSKAGVAARHSEDRGQPLAVAAPAPESSTTPAGEGDEEQPGSRDYQTARARREHFAALAAERDYNLSIAKLLDADEATAMVRAVVTSLRARLEGLAPTLAAHVAGIRDERQVQSVIAQEVEHALEECARQLSKMGKGVE